MNAQCKKCKWHGTPTLKECNTVYVQAFCPKCDTFIKFVKRTCVSEKDIVLKRGSFWDKIKRTDTNIRPAYILNKELSNFRVKFAAAQMENEQLREIIVDATKIITEAMKREGIIEHVPEWMKE